MDAYNTLKDYIREEGVLRKRKLLKRDDFLKNAGSSDNNIYFIEEGGVRVFFMKNLIEYTLCFGYKESIITAIDSFFSNTPSKLEIQTLRKTEVSFLSKSEFLNFLN